MFDYQQFKNNSVKWKRKILRLYMFYTTEKKKNAASP